MYSSSKENSGLETEGDPRLQEPLRKALAKIAVQDRWISFLQSLLGQAAKSLSSLTFQLATSPKVTIRRLDGDVGVLEQWRQDNPYRVEVGDQYEIHIRMGNQEWKFACCTSTHTNDGEAFFVVAEDCTGERQIIVTEIKENESCDGF